MEILNYQHSEITETIIRAFFNVYNKLGYGFLEKVYERAMMIEIARTGFRCKCQQPISVYYDDEIVGNYFADIVVDDCVILEIKAASTLMPEHEAQLTNYLRASSIEVGLLFNFGTKAQFKRKVFSDMYKSSS